MTRYLFSPPARPVPVLVDTDMATDCDDAGALAVLHALASAGEAEILAVLVNNRGRYSTGAVAALNAYYGRPHIPIGAYNGREIGLDDTPIFEVLAKDMAEYGHTIVTRDDVPDAVSVYRKTLAARPGKDAVIISIGHLNNLRDLLLSPPDEIDPRNGVDLIRDSVAHAVVMGGAYPSGREHNFFARGSAAVTGAAIEGWPTPILFSGYELGEKILTGQNLQGLPPENPMVRAYAMHGSKPLEKGRPSWDQSAIVAAIQGPGRNWNLSAPGRNQIEADGSNQWIDDSTGAHAYLTEKMPPGEVAAEIEALMRHSPGQ